MSKRIRLSIYPEEKQETDWSVLFMSGRQRWSTKMSTKFNRSLAIKRFQTTSRSFSKSMKCLCP